MIDFANPLAVETEVTEMEVIEVAPASPPMVFDLIGVKNALAPYKARIDEMVSQAKAIIVKDESSQVLAVELGTTARKLKKQIEDVRTSTVKPLNEHVKDVNNLAKSFIDPLDVAERDLKNKISSYQTELRLEQQRREAAAREEARKLQEKIEAEARKLREEAEAKARAAAEELRKKEEAGKLAEAERLALQKKIEEETAAANAPTPQVQSPVIAEVPKAVRTESGSAHQRMDWVFEVEDESQIPREFMCIDEKKIRQAVRAGIRQIAGVKIYEKPSTTFR